MIVKDEVTGQLVDVMEYWRIDTLYHGGKIKSSCFLVYVHNQYCHATYFRNESDITYSI